MFKKILIANRGEIACRVAATARRLGIRTVAVHSDADAQAQHVLACDEAVHIGGSAPKESYLLADRILAVAKATGAEAVHPRDVRAARSPDEHRLVLIRERRLAHDFHRHAAFVVGEGEFDSLTLLGG